MDELLQRVAELRGMPASLVERSAQARADTTGATLEEVLQEWAGEAGDGDAAQTADADTEAEAIDAATDAVDETEDSGVPDGGEATSATDKPVTQEVTTDHLVQLAADAKRMPPKLILSSATARAEHSGSSLDDVLADWAGVDLQDLREQAAASSVDTQEPTTDTRPTPSGEEPESDTKAAVAPVAVAAAAAGAITMDELLERVAEAKGMPASLAKRSAEAKAKKTGEPVEAVLAEWAGVDVSDVATSAGGAEQGADDSPPVDKPADESLETEADATAGVEMIEASSVEASDATDDDTPVARGRYPRWLAAAFILIPLLAVGYILVTPNGPDCGTAGQLLVDPVTGESVNCDGTEYGLSTVDYFAQGEGLYSQCVACHAADGSGGAGPAFSGGAVLATFPSDSCGDHIEWIRLGTAGWPDPTYGATEKPVGGGGLMPAFGSMDDEQLASVSLYERVQFGGQTLEEAEIDCGLVGDDGAGSDESVEATGS